MKIWIFGLAALAIFAVFVVVFVRGANQEEEKVRAQFAAFQKRFGKGQSVEALPAAARELHAYRIEVHGSAPVAEFKDPESLRPSERLAGQSNRETADVQMRRVVEGLAQTPSGIVLVEFDGPGILSTTYRFHFENHSVTDVEHSTAPAEGY